ncbi:MAG: 2,3-bisphosphoglycerate-independent phosphoglycerate mutase [Candidatus Kerfeldbacteria bacterium]|nr:2,3-bisphosphoglycerate-independent phosphoglycerate mutase [Candidatus Kerfeldbacteria bacterium]
MKADRPLVLLILDGWGLAPADEHNAITLAKTPIIKRLMQEYTWTAIGAAGEAIGLAPGHQGSTEIGHLIMSAGRNVLLPQLQIRAALNASNVGEIPAYKEAMAHVRKNGTRLHLIGLLSNAGVHSYDELCHELIRAAARAGLKREQVLIHIFADGRDTPPHSLPEHVARLQAVMNETHVGVIASLQGRVFPMDRDHRWERVKAAYRLLTEGTGIRSAKNIEEAIRLARTANENDEVISPTSIVADGVIRDTDAVINFNYRVDREIEITQALVETDFQAFPRIVWPQMHYVATLPYYAGMPTTAAFERHELSMNNILPEVLSAHGLTQYRVTETEKWAYVTKIFNGMREETFIGETRHLIPSDKIDRFDRKPEMKAREIAADIVEQLRMQKYDVTISNICNADMVGHTGNLEATIRACEAVDSAVGMIYEKIKKQNGVLMITADHGNAEHLWDHKNDTHHTQHTTNQVPCILADTSGVKRQLRNNGALKDIAPTILQLLHIPQPPEMSGSSLIRD